MHPAEQRSQEDETRLVLELTKLTTGRWLEDTDPTPSFISDRLYLGSIRDARDGARLRELGITHVVCLVGPMVIGAPLDLTYKIFDARDVESYPIHEHFEDAHTFISSALEKSGAVLVHCAAGVSRSATIVCAYLMRSQKVRSVTSLVILPVIRSAWLAFANLLKMNCREAVLFVNKQRNCASPNQGFLRSLLRYEARIEGLTTISQ